MRYFLDTEFHDAGLGAPLRLISIGLVREDAPKSGKRFYGVNTDYNWGESTEWLRENVKPSLYERVSDTSLFIHSSADVIRDGICGFLREDPRPEFWAYHGARGWVLFCQLFGGKKQLTKFWPKICLDIEQLRLSYGAPKLPEQKGTRHNALADAEWYRESWRMLNRAHGARPARESESVT